jgi:hypothetical protein
MTPFHLLLRLRRHVRLLPILKLELRCITVVRWSRKFMRLMQRAHFITPPSLMLLIA